MKPREIGVVDCGRLGLFLHSAWGDTAVAVCHRREPFQVEHAAHHCRDFDEPLDIPEADVIVEKPIARNLARTDPITKTRDAIPSVRTADHTPRFNPLVVAATEATRTGVMRAFRSLVAANHADRTQIPPSYRLRNEGTSSGILVENGVGFFNPAAAQAAATNRCLEGQQ